MGLLEVIFDKSAPKKRSPEGLREVDHYLQQSIRFFATDRRTNAQYRLPYYTMRELGYKSLVHEYYKQHKLLTA